MKEKKEYGGQDNSNELSKTKEESSEMRRIIIEHDGNNVHVVQADVAGKIEFVGILENLVAFLKTHK